MFLPYPINSEILISFEPAKIGCNVGHILIGKKNLQVLQSILQIALI